MVCGSNRPRNIFRRRTLTSGPAAALQLFLFALALAGAPPRFTAAALRRTAAGGARWLRTQQLLSRRHIPGLHAASAATTAEIFGGPGNASSACSRKNEAILVTLHKLGGVTDDLLRALRDFSGNRPVFVALDGATEAQKQKVAKLLGTEEDHVLRVDYDTTVAEVFQGSGETTTSLLVEGEEVLSRPNLLRTSGHHHHHHHNRHHVAVGGSPEGGGVHVSSSPVRAQVVQSLASAQDDLNLRKKEQRRRFDVFQGIHHSPAKPFALWWLAEGGGRLQGFDSAWVIEWDAHYEGGEWDQLFSSFKPYCASDDKEEKDDSGGAGADLVAEFEEMPRTWSHWKKCTLEACQDARQALTTPRRKGVKGREEGKRGFLPVFRVSRRLAEDVLENLRSGQTGHHEAFVANVCWGEQRWNCRTQDIRSTGHVGMEVWNEQLIPRKRRRGMLYHPVKRLEAGALY